MKRMISVLLIALLLLTGCASNTSAANWQAQYDLGVRYLSEGNYEEAILCFEAAIEIDARKAEAYVGLADAYIELGNYDRAEEILAEALENVEDADALLEKLETIETMQQEETPSEEETLPEPEAEHEVLLAEFLQRKPRVENYSAVRGFAVAPGSSSGMDLKLADHALPQGVLAERMGDLDGDGTAELVTVELEQNDINLVLYMAVDGQVQEVDRVCILEADSWDNILSKIKVDLFTRLTNGKQMFFCERYAVGGLVSDGFELGDYGYCVTDGHFEEILSKFYTGAGMMIFDDVNAENAAYTNVGLAPVVAENGWEVEPVAGKSAVEMLANISEIFNGENNLWQNRDMPELISPMNFSITVYS